jgi:hypothetical protein
LDLTSNGNSGLMIRFASHYLFLPVNNLYKLHWIELSEGRHFRKLNPLENEIASIIFLSGIIIIVKENTFSSANELLNIIEDSLKQFPEVGFFELLRQMQLEKITVGERVNLYHLDGIDLLSTEFRTDNCRSCRHIQRLC